MRKLFLILVTLVVLGFGAWLIIALFFSTSYSFTIVSENDAQISISTAKNEIFQEIGTGSAEYTTKQTEPVYVRATKNGSITMQAVSPVDSDGQTIELRLFETKKSTILLENPVSSPFLEKNIVYGIYELNNSMISAALDGGPTPPKFSYVSIPYVDSVVWLDSTNYHYNKYGGGVGTVINDSNEGTYHFDDLLLAYYGYGRMLYVDKYENKPLVLLAPKAIYVSKDFGRTMQPIAEIESSESFFLGTDSNYIYYGENIAPSAGASEGEGVEGSETAFASGLTLYDYSGKSILHASLQGVSTINDAAGYYSNTLVATDRGLLQLDKSGEIIDTFSFSFNLDDIVVYQDKVYLFSGSGLWLLDLSSGSHSLIYNFDSSPYVAGSVQPSDIDGEILFTTLNNSVNYGTLEKLNLK